ncbi:metallophosphoesterase [Peribacillus sp. SCS-37]|uniref:metallophosphoesterase n=1 Tax=Paraperibacillus esterisolvens TaxID=3115296 RepID=UPI003906ABE4
MRRNVTGRILFIGVYNLLLLYIGWHGWIWLHSAFGLHNPISPIIITGIMGYSYFFRKKSEFLRALGSIWFGILQFSILILPAADLILLFMKLAGKLDTAEAVIAGWIVIAVLIVIFGYGLFNAYSPVIRRYNIKVDKMCGERKTLKLAAASDMHFGRLSGVRHARRLAAELAEIKPDLILLPGDIIDDDPGPFRKKNIDKIMGEFEAPLGVYGVLGNHEYYGGGVAEYLKIMESIGIDILLDETIEITEGLILAGRKDRTDRGRMGFAALTRSVDSEQVLIAMDHQPYELKEAEQAGVDVLLSGHTHRGQMAPNHLITRRMYELDWGYLKKNNMHAFVSSGYGFWGPPLRIGSRSEILEITIEFTGVKGGKMD